MRLAEQPPRTAERPPVAEAFQLRDRSLGDAPVLVRCLLRGGERPLELSLDRGPELGPAISTLAGQLDSVVEDHAGPFERPRLHQRAAELGAQQRATWRPSGCSSASARLQERHGRGHVASVERAAPGAPQQRGCAPPELACPRVGRPKLGAVPMRLLEVVGDDLLELGGALAEVLRDPVRKPLVQLSPKLLRHGLVGDVADQHVPEAEAVLALGRCQIGADQALADELAQGRARPTNAPGAGQMSTTAPRRNCFADDGGALDHGALLDRRAGRGAPRSRPGPRAARGAVRRRPSPRPLPPAARGRAGFPRPRRRSERRVSGSRSSPPESPAIRASAAASESGSRATIEAFSRGALHAGRRSSRSGRARQRITSTACRAPSPRGSRRGRAASARPSAVLEAEDERALARERLDVAANAPERLLRGGRPFRHADRREHALGRELRPGRPRRAARRDGLLAAGRRGRCRRAART